MRNTHRALLTATCAVLICAAASAADFGAHLGYFGNDVKKAYVGADVAIPVGMFAVVPTLDYSRSHGIGLWYANVDGDLRFKPSGDRTQFSVGAGPTWGYVTGYGSSGRAYSIVHGQQYGGGGGTGPVNGGGISGGVLANGFGGRSRAWGWDVNAGATFATALRPYVTVRYDKVKNIKTTGIAVGLRFGM